MSVTLIESVLYVLLSIWITDARESVFCQFLRVFLGSDISSYEREQMAPSVTALYNLSFLSAMGHFNTLNVLVNSRGNK